MTELLQNNFPWLVTAGAALATSWRYFLMLFSWVRSLVIVKVKIQNHTTRAVILEHFNKTMKRSKYNDFSYNIDTRFIHSVGRSLYVVMKTIGFSAIYYKGGFPILVSAPGTDSERSKSDSAMTITFLRGTLNIEDEMKLAAESLNRQLIDSPLSNNRYRNRRHFGTNGYRDRDRGNLAQKEASEPPSFHDERIQEPLNFSRSDLLPDIEHSVYHGLAYSQKIKDQIGYIKHWKNSMKWFHQRGIPWTRSIRLRGKPGTGKTSFAKAVAKDLNMPIHILDLSSMSNEELVNAWEQVVGDAPSIALFEDIDRLFNEKGEFLLENLTLDCLLNCLSGVGDSDGVLTITTVNFPERLDPALGVIDETGKSTRPGRLDFEIVFEELDLDCRRQIAGRILDEYPEIMQQVIREGEGDTGAQFTQRCCQKATELYWEGFKGTERVSQALKDAMAMSYVGEVRQ